MFEGYKIDVCKGMNYLHNKTSYLVRSEKKYKVAEEVLWNNWSCSLEHRARIRNLHSKRRKLRKEIKDMNRKSINFRMKHTDLEIYRNVIFDF